MVEGIVAEVIRIPGHNGDLIEAYYSRPVTDQPVPGMIVLHHGPGFDEWSKEVYRKFAAHGFATIGPHLYSRHGPGNWQTASDVAHAQPGMGMPDAQVVGDTEGALAFLRAQPSCTGKVGVIGFCSGGRQSYMTACRIPSLDAAVDCWGGRVYQKPEDLIPEWPVAPIDMTAGLNCPMLGIFGNEDANPDPAQVNRIEEELKRHGKEYEFHRFDGAGHGIFAVDRPTYRPQQAVEGWNAVFNFLDRHLRTGA